MKSADELPLYAKVYKYQQYLYGLIRIFPKAYKYTLGQMIIDLNWQLLDLIIATNSLPNAQKAGGIKQASVCFDQLKYRQRMAYELKLITHKKYAYIISINEELGKMLSGWLKWANTQ